MQELLGKYFVYLFPLFFIANWLLIMYVIALVGGWRLLTGRFRAQGPFTGPKWNMQAARMRFFCSYNNCLTVGADSSGLFVVPMLLFRIWHPPLLVPWSEITFERKKVLFFFNYLELRLGRSERVPFTVSAKLGARNRSRSRPHLAHAVLPGHQRATSANRLSFGTGELTH